MSVTFRQKRTSFDIVYFSSALVAIPTLVISARCSASIRVTNFCTGSSRSGRITIATSGWARFSSTNWALSAALSTTWLLNLIVSVRSIEIVCTCEELIGKLVAPLEGMTRLMLFSSSGVVIIKMMSKTKARSSRGVMLISLSDERLWRCE